MVTGYGGLGVSGMITPTLRRERRLPQAVGGLRLLLRTQQCLGLSKVNVVLNVCRNRTAY